MHFRHCQHFAPSHNALQSKREAWIASILDLARFREWRVYLSATCGTVNTAWCYHSGRGTQNQSPSPSSFRLLRAGRSFHTHAGPSEISCPAWKVGGSDDFGGHGTGPFCGGAWQFDIL